MKYLSTPIAHTNQFSWNKQSRTFVAEASDLLPGHQRGFALGQAYYDAADVGFTLRNTETGREVKLVETDSVEKTVKLYGNDGKVEDQWTELVARVFIPIDPAERKVLNFEVHILGISSNCKGT